MAMEMLVGHAQAGTVARWACRTNAWAQAMVDMAGATQQLLTRVFVLAVVAMPIAIQYQNLTISEEEKERR